MYDPIPDCLLSQLLPLQSVPVAEKLHRQSIVGNLEEGGHVLPEVPRQHRCARLPVRQQRRLLARVPPRHAPTMGRVLQAVADDKVVRLAVVVE